MKVNNLLTAKNLVIIILLATAFYGGYHFVNTYTIESTNVAGSAITNSTQPDIPTTTNTNIDLGQIPMKEGSVQLKYIFKNTTSQPLKLNNLYTSCMCTKAKIKTAKTETIYAGMKGHTSGLMPINPNITLDPGQEAQVLVEFDPNAHGPQGTGPMQRTIVIETNNQTQPMMEFTFSGTVTR